MKIIYTKFILFSLLFILVGCANTAISKNNELTKEDIITKAIELIKNGEYKEASSLVFNDLNNDSVWEETVKTKASLPYAKRVEVNLVFFAWAKSSEQGEYYKLALNDLEQTEPIDGLLTSEELTKLKEKLKIKITQQNKDRKSQGVSIGMTKENVLLSSWGKPKKINKTTTSSGIIEQWIYENGRYLYFEDGILTTIQD